MAKEIIMPAAVNAFWSWDVSGSSSHTLWSLPVISTSVLWSGVNASWSTSLWMSISRTLFQVIVSHAITTGPFEALALAVIKRLPSGENVTTTTESPKSSM